MKLLSSIILALFTFAYSQACTNIIVGKKASKDGSVLVSYSADSYGAYGVMKHFKAGSHKKGEKREIRDWETNRFLGEIDEAPVTYNVVGNMNEHQLTIAETTFGGREELVDTTGMIDYGTLIYVTLQRARSAREAIRVMDRLVQKYGYCSEGETFSIADPKEAFIMEMVGKGPGGHGAVWVAVRVPDDAICVHANQSRIHKFMKLPKEDVFYSKDVISMARRMNLFDGDDEDFDFANAYCPLDFGGARYCEARVWAMYNKFCDGMDKYLSYSMGEDLKAEPLPLYVYPTQKIGVIDVIQAMGDHYDGTAMDMCQDPGAGAYLSPYRPRPLAWEFEGKKYFNERPVGTQQSSFSFVSQMRENLPNCIGGVLWFANDDSHTTPYTPVYCCATEVPECYTLKYANAVKFSLKSAFWVQNWVSNMVYPRYSMLYPDVKKKLEELHTLYFLRQAEVENKATELLKQDKAKAIEYLTNYSIKTANEMMGEWVNLGWYLVVKYNDMVQKIDAPNGSFEAASFGTDTIMAKVLNPGYPMEVRKKIVEATGEKFLIK